MITLSNNKQNKQNTYSNSIYKIYLKPCHDHFILPTYFQNNKKTHNDLARRLFTLKRFQYCRFQNTFQLAFFRSLLSTCRSRLLFASLRERRKFGVDQRITINMGVNLCHSVVPQASNVILQCMHVYKVILSHSNGSSSARRLEVDGRLHNYYQVFKLSSQIAGIWNIYTSVILLIWALQILLYKFGNEHF